VLLSCIVACFTPQAQTGWLSPTTATICIHTFRHRLGGQSRAGPRSLGSQRLQRHTPPFLQRLQGLLTLFAKSFASFNHSTCALSVPWWYCALQETHLALQTAVSNSSTLGYSQQHSVSHSTLLVVWDNIPLAWSIPGHLPGTVTSLASPTAP